MNKLSDTKKTKMSIGSWLSTGSPYIAEIMAKAGFEWLVIDMEHSAANGIMMVQRLIQVIDLSGCKPLVRVGSSDPLQIKLVLDAGAKGIIVPMVNSKDDALAVVRAAKYAPQGRRGVGLWRAQGYGRNFKEYFDTFNDEGLVIAQVEHIDAIDNIIEILAVDGIDGFIVGPYDLSASIGAPGDFSNPGYLKAIKKLENVIAQTNKWVGIHIVHPDRKVLRERLAKGYNFIAYGVDFTYLTSIVDDEVNYIEQLLQEEGQHSK